MGWSLTRRVIMHGPSAPPKKDRPRLVDTKLSEDVDPDIASEPQVCDGNSGAFCGIPYSNHASMSAALSTRYGGRFFGKVKDGLRRSRSKGGDDGPIDHRDEAASIPNTRGDYHIRINTLFRKSVLGMVPQ